MVVGTWNLENLFRPGSEFGPRDAATYERKLAGLAAVIDAAAPDVLAVQEVGEPEALADLVARLEGDWEVETATVFEPDHPIRVGVLSRAPLGRATQVTAFPRQLEPVQVDDRGAAITAMPRGALSIRAGEVDLVICHLKSKLLRFPGGRFAPRDEGERARFGAYALHRRAAEAATVRAAADALLDGAGRERPVIVLGDLNDEPLAATTQILLGPPGSELGTAGYDQPDRGDAWRLWNLAPLIPEDHRYTRVFAGRRELIDHILVSRFLVERAVAADTGGVRPLAIWTDPRERRDEPASDHAPVFARFEL